jgi:hypothetical protein
VLEVSILPSILKRQYGLEAKGNLECFFNWMKSTFLVSANTSGYMGCKSCAFAEGAMSDKMKDQIHKDFHPDLGCSGSLNPTGTVHSVNVGTSYLGHRTGLAATDVRYEGRESCSSRRYGKHTTWRRTLAC